MMCFLVKKYTAVFFVIALFSSCLNADQTLNKNVFIVVQKELYPHLDQQVFNDWLGQLEKEGWEATVLEPEHHEVRTPYDLNVYLTEKDITTESAHAQAPVNGVILVGAFPKPHVDLSPNAMRLASDLCFMAASDQVVLVSERLWVSACTKVKPNKTLASFNAWVSRIEYIAKGIKEGSDEWLRESGNFINQYLKKNTDCRSQGFDLKGCLTGIETSNKKFQESRALIGMTDSDPLLVEGMALSSVVAGEAFLESFKKAQVSRKTLKDIFFNDGWEHSHSFLGDMYRTYARTHSSIGSSAAPAGIPPLDKLMLYFLKLPALLTAISSSVVYAWAYPSSQLYLAALWGVAAVLSVVPGYSPADHYYLPARHYLPILLGDGTLRQPCNTNAL